ncbi:MAG TPA: EAL domain-containing protein [Steroidobacteraceae bacterium]|nr:EAL domain-containing protein [Steroidobacteraceae bacterium]
MELDRNQPSPNRLRENLAPWFDHPAAWLVLLCFALTVFAAFTGLAPGGPNEELVVLLTAAAVSLAAISLAWRASELPAQKHERRSAWRWLAFALLAQLVAAFAVRVLRPFESPAVQAIADLLQFAFFPCAALAATGLLLSTRGRAFGPQFWLEATLVALCVGTVLWLALPHDLANDALPVRGEWTVGLDVVLGVLAAILLLRRSNWQGWPGLATFALALGTLVGAHLLEAHAAAAGAVSPYAGPLRVAALAALGVAAHLEYLRLERRAPPMDAAERGSPFAALMPYAALMLAGYALLALHDGSFTDPAGLIAWVVCIAAGLLFARQAIATALAVAVQTGLASRSAEARFNALIRNTADVIAIVDVDGTVSYVTPTAERIFGFAARDLIGQHLDELVAFDDRARLREFLGRDLARAGASAVIEARVPRGDERERVVEIHGTNMEAEPAIGGRLLNLRDMTDRKGMEEQLKRMALHDPLTLLANRSLFRDRVEHAVAVSRRNGRGVAVIFVDLDNFKRINDTHGHAIGDRVLHRSAQRLVKATRNGDTVARFGGDEFAVLLENLTTNDPVLEIAARIVESLQEPLDLPVADMRVAASVGIAFSSAHDGVEELMRNADVAMYAAKSAGKGRYAVYEPSMQHAECERREMETEIDKAVRGAQFFLHYQPIVDLRSGYLLGVEALIRWKHPARGMIKPADFIPIAEETGQIVPLGRWVLAQACREVKVWQSRLPEGRQVRVSVNVSATQLSKSDICADVGRALEISELDPGCLVIELTETALMHNSESVLATLTSLKKLGVRIAIDNFGTGYSSLSYLHRFPIDILKIDRTFVERLGGVDGGEDFARAIITLGGTLDLEVVAEGIELEHQQRGLIELGCVAGQGFYYARPGLLHELEYSVHMARRRTLADTLPQGARITATGRFVVGDLKPADFVATGTFGRGMSDRKR